MILGNAPNLTPATPNKPVPVVPVPELKPVGKSAAQAKNAMPVILAKPAPTFTKAPTPAPAPTPVPAA